MRKSGMTQKLNRSAALGPFVRTGIDAGCVACGEPIISHIGTHGWLGCKGANRVTSANVPFVLVPVPVLSQALSSKPASFVSQPTTQPRKPVAASSLPLGPQVAYVARYPVTHNAIDRLPPHDRKVYGLIAKGRKGGATRGHLLDVMKARQSTGRVDGAVRRLRLRKVITRQPVAA